MWNNEDEVNENGETVQLYLPVTGPARRNNIDTADSHIGGKPYQRDSPVCAICNEMMNLLVQLRLPNTIKDDGSKVDRTVFVFACPQANCFETVKFTEGFSSSDGRVMSCQTLETPAIVRTLAAPVAPVKSSWYADDDDDEDDNDWGAQQDDADGIAGLEEAMAAMEQNLKDGALPKQTKKPESKPGQSQNENASNTAFPCYILTKQFEPLAPNPVAEEDDVGLSASDDKIRNMLARYMAEEEDEEILAALKGTSMGGGAGDEEDERLTEEDRLLLGFQDRVRRVPRQVIRYARGGVPLWSIPNSKNDKQLWSLPICPACGTKCSFEMQLLPSLLHVLEVDRFSSPEKGAEDGTSGIGELLSNGMNWGSVAVFTCPNGSCGSMEGALVIQSGVDENPLPRDSNIDFTPTMAVVEDMDDDADFEPYTN